MIVEGPTEVVGLPIALGKLHDSELPEFADVNSILSQICLVDGSGDSYGVYCTLANSHGVSPIVFLDGDKRNETKKARDKHPDVPFVFLSDRSEFEQIVPAGTYVQALQDCTRETGLVTNWQDITLEAFENWRALAGPPVPNMMFSKQIGRWLQDEFSGFEPHKPLVMRKALENTDPASIVVEGLDVLVRELRRLLANNHGR